MKKQRQEKYIWPIDVICDGSGACLKTPDLKQKGACNQGEKAQNSNTYLSLVDTR